MVFRHEMEQKISNSIVGFVKGTGTKEQVFQAASEVVEAFRQRAE